MTAVFCFHVLLSSACAHNRVKSEEDPCLRQTRTSSTSTNWGHFPHFSGGDGDALLALILVVLVVAVAIEALHQASLAEDPACLRPLPST